MQMFDIPLRKGDTPPVFDDAKFVDIVASPVSRHARHEAAIARLDAPRYPPPTREPAENSQKPLPAFLQEPIWL
jgi:hypothetical protein